MSYGYSESVSGRFFFRLQLLGKNCDIILFLFPPLFSNSCDGFGTSKSLIVWVCHHSPSTHKWQSMLTGTIFLVLRYIIAVLVYFFRILRQPWGRKFVRQTFKFSTIWSQMSLSTHQAAIWHRDYLVLSQTQLNMGCLCICWVISSFE